MGWRSPWAFRAALFWKAPLPLWVAPRDCLPLLCPLGGSPPPTPVTDFFFSVPLGVCLSTLGGLVLAPVPCR